MMIYRATLLLICVCIFVPFILKVYVPTLEIYKLEKNYDILLIHRYICKESV